MSSEPNKILGKIPCRICSTPAVLREAKTTLAYYTCNECSCQVFARGASSDAKLRALLAPTAAPTPSKETVADEKPKQPAAATKPVAGAKPAAGKPAPAAKRDVWSI